MCIWILFKWSKIVSYSTVQPTSGHISWNSSSVKQLWKLCAYWVLKMLSNEHKANWIPSAFVMRKKEKVFLTLLWYRGWNNMDSSLQTREQKSSNAVASYTSPVVKNSKYCNLEKIIAVGFWDCKGIFLIDFLQRGESINADWYCKTLCQSIKQKRRSVRTVKKK